MAKCNLNGVSLDEVKRSANNAYAAGIDSGEIFSVACRHSKNGNILLAVEGKALTCRDFNGNTFLCDGCILYNPPLTRAIVEACNGDDASIFIVGGEVSKTAPATATSSDTVLSKEELQKEAAEIKAKFFNLKGAEKAAAEARLEAIETQLKTA